MPDSPRTDISTYVDIDDKNQRNDIDQYAITAAVSDPSDISKDPKDQKGLIDLDDELEDNILEWKHPGTGTWKPFRLVYKGYAVKGIFLVNRLVEKWNEQRESGTFPGPF